MVDHLLPQLTDGVARLAEPARREIAAGLLVAPDGRYLLQLRDDFDWLPMAGHWTLFGGGIEPGETAEAALRREIHEELTWHPREVRPVSVAVHAVWPARAPIRLHFFAAPFTFDDLDAMVQCEGVGKALFTAEEAAALPKIAPWDLCALLLHARHAILFRASERYDRPGPPVEPA